MSSPADVIRQAEKHLAYLSREDARIRLAWANLAAKARLALFFAPSEHGNEQLAQYAIWETGATPLLINSTRIVDLSGLSGKLNNVDAIVVMNDEAFRSSLWCKDLIVTARTNFPKVPLIVLRHGQILPRDEDLEFYLRCADSMVIADVDSWRTSAVFLMESLHKILSQQSAS